MYNKANFSAFAKLMWVLSAFTNALPVASPLLLALRREKHRGFAASLAVGFAINSHWLISTWLPSHTLAIGYFLWWASFLALAIGFALDRREEAI